MSPTTHMNIISGQGNTINEVHKVNKIKSNPEKQKDNSKLSEGKLVDIRV